MIKLITTKNEDNMESTINCTTMKGYNKRSSINSELEIMDHDELVFLIKTMRMTIKGLKYVIESKKQTIKMLEMK